MSHHIVEFEKCKVRIVLYDCAGEEDAFLQACNALHGVVAGAAKAGKPSVQIDPSYRSAKVTYHGDRDPRD